MEHILVQRMYTENGGQWLNVRIEISDEWCPSGVSTGTGAL